MALVRPFAGGSSVKSTYWSDRMASTNALRIAGSPGATTIDAEADAAEAPRWGVLLIAVMGLPEVEEAVGSVLLPRPSPARTEADGRRMVPSPVGSRGA